MRRPLLQERAACGEHEEGQPEAKNQPSNDGQAGVLGGPWRPGDSDLHWQPHHGHKQEHEVDDDLRLDVQASGNDVRVCVSRQ